MTAQELVDLAVRNLSFTQEHPEYDIRVYYRTFITVRCGDRAIPCETTEEAVTIVQDCMEEQDGN